MMCVCVRLDILLAMIAHYILIENYIFTQTHIQLYANVNSSQTVVMDTPLPCVCSVPINRKSTHLVDWTVWWSMCIHVSIASFVSEHWTGWSTLPLALSSRSFWCVLRITFDFQISTSGKGLFEWKARERKLKA